jgi:hypothetical protein
MNEHDEDDDIYEEEEEGAEFAMEIVNMLKKIQQQLGYLEKKIDSLVNQSQGGRPQRERHFSKPFRPGQSREQGEGGQRSEWRGPRRDRGHGEHRHNDNRGFNPKKKHYENRDR